MRCKVRVQGFVCQGRHVAVVNAIVGALIIQKEDHRLGL